MKRNRMNFNEPKGPEWSGLSRDGMMVWDGIEWDGMRWRYKSGESFPHTTSIRREFNSIWESRVGREREGDRERKTDAEQTGQKGNNKA